MCPCVCLCVSVYGQKNCPSPCCPAVCPLQGFYGHVSVRGQQQPAKVPPLLSKPSRVYPTTPTPFPPPSLLLLRALLHCGPCRPALITNVLMACAILCPMLLLLSMPPLQAVVGYSKTLSTFLDLGSYVKHSIWIIKRLRLKSSYPNSRLVYTHPEHPPPPLLGQAIHRDTHKYPYNLLPAQFDNCNLTNYATKELHDLHT